MASESQFGKNKGLWLLLVLSVYLAAFIYTERYPRNRLMVDSFEYLKSAENLYKSGVFYAANLEAPINPIYYSRRSPGYPILIILGGLEDTLVVLLQVVLILIGALFLSRICRFIFPETNFRGLLILLYLLYPAQVIYSQMIMTEILFQFLLLSSVFSLVVFLEKKNPTWIFFCNLCIGFAVLTKPVMVYFWIPNLALHILLYFRIRSKSLLTLSLIPLIMVLAWSYRNYRLTGYFHFSSILMTQMSLLSGSDPIAPLEDSEMKDYSESTREAYLKTFLNNWTGTLKKFARDPLFFFLDPGRFDIYEFLDKPHTVRSWDLLEDESLRWFEKLKPFSLPIGLYLLLVGLLNVLITVGFGYFLWVRTRSPELKLFLFVLVAYLLAAVMVGAMGTSRYRLPVEPLLILSVAPLLDRCVLFFKRDPMSQSELDQAG